MTGTVGKMENRENDLGTKSLPQLERQLKSIAKRQVSKHVKYSLLEVSSLELVNKIKTQLYNIAAFDPEIRDSKKEFESLYFLIQKIPMNSATIGQVYELCSMYNVMGKFVNWPYRFTNLKDALVWENWVIKLINERTLVLRIRKYLPIGTRIAVKRPFKTTDSIVMSVSVAGLRVKINQGEFTGQIKLIPMAHISSETRTRKMNKRVYRKEYGHIIKEVNGGTEVVVDPGEPFVKLSMPMKDLLFSLEKLIGELKNAKKISSIHINKLISLTEDISFEYIESGFSNQFNKLIDLHNSLFDEFELDGHLMTIKQQINAIEEERASSYDPFTYHSGEREADEEEMVYIDPDVPERGFEFEAQQGVKTYDQSYFVKIDNKPKTKEGEIAQNFSKALFSNETNDTAFSLRIPQELYKDVEKMKTILITEKIDTRNLNVLNAIVIARLFFELNANLPSQELVTPELLLICGEGEIFGDYRFTACAAEVEGFVKDMYSGETKIMSAVTLIKNMIDLYIVKLGLKIHTVRKVYDAPKAFDFRIKSKTAEIRKRKQRKPVYVKFDKIGKDPTGRINMSSRFSSVILPKNVDQIVDDLFGDD